jgi:hypothetical protein
MAVEKNIRLEPHKSRDLLVSKKSNKKRPKYQPPGGGATSLGSGRDVGGGRDTPDRGGHHPSAQTYTPVQAGTLSDPREKQDYFEQSWSGPKRFFGLAGGYKNLRTPSNTAQGYRSGIGGLLRGALGFFGGVPGKIASGFMTARNLAKRTGAKIGEFGEEVEEFGQYPTLDRWLNRNTDKYKDKPYRGQGSAEGGRIGYQGGELVEDASMVEATPAGLMEENIEEVQGEPSREQLEAIAFEIFQLPLEQLDEEQLMVVYQAAMEQEPYQEDIQFAEEGPAEGIASLV